MNKMVRCEAEECRTTVDVSKGILMKQRLTSSDDHILETAWPHLSLGPRDFSHPHPQPPVSMWEEVDQIHLLGMLCLE